MLYQVVLATVMLSATSDGDAKAPPVTCEIRGEKTCRVGERPRIYAVVTNRTEREITLPKALDGSERGGRYPLCKFIVEGPLDWKSKKRGFCPLFNRLTESDFVRTPPGGVVLAATITHVIQAFETPGEYRVVFVYSTANENLESWLGDVKNPVLVELFRQTQKFEVRSAEFVFTVTE